MQGTRAHSSSTPSCVNNFVLVKFLGLCPFIGRVAQLETAPAWAWDHLRADVVVGVQLSVDTYILMPLGIEYLAHDFLHSHYRRGRTVH